MARALPPGFHSGDAESERGLLLREAILDALHVPLDNERENDIGESFAGTYDWIFDSTKHQFGSWLARRPEARNGEDESGEIFWINGYPGSGKSTLMRHIHSNPQLVEHLHHWSGEEEVTVARFYFWESGSVIQRSLTGLLRSLLSQLLVHTSTLIPWAFADLWVGLWISTTVQRIQKLASWKQEDLVNAFERYFRDDERPYTFLLIDGLDEFDGDDSAMSDLMQLLGRIVRGGRVKLCVSSRPWPVFEETFGAVPTLRLQDLTSGDMKQYIQGRLWDPLREPGTEADRNRAETQLLRKADGVFLWIAFAVSDILSYCGSRSSIEDVARRINQLPAGLEPFFDLRLLHGSPLPEDMSRVFQLMKARQEVAAFTGDNDGSTMSLWELDLASRRIGTRDASVSQVRQIPSAEVQDRCRRTSDMVAQATHSLVRVHDSLDDGLDPERGLTYIHRTVKEWLANPSAWTQVVHLAPDTQPHLDHLRAVILSLRETVDRPRKSRRILDWWTEIVLSMTHARLLRSTAPETLEQLVKLMDLLNETLEWYYFPVRNNDPRLDHWARSCMGTIESRGNTPYEEPFLSLLVRFGVVEYVRWYLEHETSYTEGEGQSVLDWSVMYLCNRQQSVYPLSDPGIVALLLDRGLDPNHRWLNPNGKRTKSPWKKTIEGVQQGLRKGWIQDLNDEDTRRWTAIVSAFLDHGADPGIEVCATHRDEKESVELLLGRVQAEKSCPEIEELLLLLQAKRRT